MTLQEVDPQKLKETIQNCSQYLQGYIAGHGSGSTEQQIGPLWKLHQLYTAAMNWVQEVEKKQVVMKEKGP